MSVGSNPRGFTLLEVLLALTLLAGGTVAIVELFQRAQMGVADGESAATAVYLAQRRLEELRNVPYGQLASEAKASVTDPTGYSRFSREIVVTTPITNLRQLVATVFWTATGGETSVTLQSDRSAN